MFFQPCCHIDLSLCRHTETSSRISPFSMYCLHVHYFKGAVLLHWAKIDYTVCPSIRPFVCLSHSITHSNGISC